MGDIEIVVKISEDSYKATCNGYMLPPDVENVVQGIKNGTPLPKGHGDLIDRKELLKQPIDEAYYPSNYVKFSHAIIEADREGEE